MHLATGEKTHLLLDPNQNVDCIQAENTFREIIPELRIREPGRRRSGQLIQLSGQSTDAMERESEGSQPFFQVFLGTLANARATIQQIGRASCRERVGK